MAETCNLDPVLPDVGRGLGLAVANGPIDLGPGMADIEMIFIGFKV